LICVIFDNLARKFKANENLKRITGSLHEDQLTFLITSRSLLLRMRNVSDKRCRENLNTYFTFNIFFFENCTIYKYKNTAEPDRPQMPIWRMRIAFWILKATNTLWICNTYCFSTATMVTQRCLNVTLYVY